MNLSLHILFLHKISLSLCIYICRNVFRQEHIACGGQTKLQSIIIYLDRGSENFWDGFFQGRIFRGESLPGGEVFLGRVFRGRGGEGFSGRKFSGGSFPRAVYNSYGRTLKGDSKCGAVVRLGVGYRLSSSKSLFLAITRGGC